MEEIILCGECDISEEKIKSEKKYIKKVHKKCEHDKRKDRCKDCGGSGICEHGKIKYSCKECGGSGICEHNRHKNSCKDCGGSVFCKHGKRKACLQRMLWFWNL